LYLHIIREFSSIFLSRDLISGKYVEDLFNWSLFYGILHDIQSLFIFFKQVKHFSNTDIRLSLESVERMEMLNDLNLSQLLVQEFNQLASNSLIQIKVN